MGIFSLDSILFSRPRFHPDVPLQRHGNDYQKMTLTWREMVNNKTVSLLKVLYDLDSLAMISHYPTRVVVKILKTIASLFEVQEENWVGAPNLTEVVL